MGKFSLYMCFALLVMALSCTNETEGVPFEEGGRDMVELTVRVATSGTRATDISLEDKIESVQVYIFADGELESFAYSETDSVKLRCFSGYKDIYAVVNNGEEQWSVRTSPQTLRNTLVTLSDEGGWNVMFGCMENVYVTPEEVESLSTITVYRLAARFAVHSVTNGTPADEGEVVTVRRAYITNVVGDAYLYSAISSSAKDPSVWYNKMGYDEESPSLLSSDIMDVPLEPGETWDIGQYFYCFPNPTENDVVFGGSAHQSNDWSPRYTRLVVEATYKEFTNYYIVSLKGVQSNYSYEVTELTITGYGSGDAEGSLSYGDMNGSGDEGGSGDSGDSGGGSDRGDDSGDSKGNEGGVGSGHWNDGDDDYVDPFDPRVDSYEGGVVSLHGGSAKVSKYSLCM